MKLHLCKIIACAIAVIATLMPSCRSSKETTGRPGITGLSTMSPSKRLESAIADKISWQSASMPVNVAIERPTSISFSGKTYIERGRSLFISLRKLGFEVAQLYITNDSITVVDKFNRRYIAESLTSLSAKTGLTLTDIQNLLTGRMFLPGKDPDATLFNVETSTDNLTWIAIPKTAIGDLQSGFLFSLSDNLMTAFAVESESSSFSVTYSDYVETHGNFLPSVNNIAFTNKKIQVGASIKWDWSRASFDSPDDMRAWTMPKGDYKRINASTLLKMR